jgi:hypothetical protein
MAALYLDGTAVFLDDAIGNRKAEAGSVTDFFGRKERVKYLAYVLGGIPSPVSETETNTSLPPFAVVFSVMVPPLSIASRALRTKLVNTC